ncbi:hypothetical protein SNOG_09279 [Parastagonospora nodorum SN15]|uniref:Uncharacterized protein n=1 Tax=Phaeosphaeria nodorum (strain SN15 / ATCC MYA-4574 / FGSC 10173) TaxID=321614 RepID=Q0UG35_PHANO|nr:hypothetical protein SNOG_09279 [Parastagonospora nodorum SN15]EAT83471.1 hypothetical protein SNOG_09279 [Parastagonospora nodorum SN15]
MCDFDGDSPARSGLVRLRYGIERKVASRLPTPSYPSFVAEAYTASELPTRSPGTQGNGIFFWNALASNT